MKYPELTDMEVQILIMLSDGLLGRAICDRLGFKNMDSFEHAKHRMFIKMDALNSANAVRIAFDMEILNPKSVGVPMKINP